MKELINTLIESNFFYNENEIVVRRSIWSDTKYLSKNLRQSDIDEIWASHHYTSEEAVLLGFYDSILCLSVIDRGHCVAMFGINSHSLVSNDAVVWLLASPELGRISIRFLRHSRKFINLMLEHYPLLYNWTDSKNKEALIWLKYCGATIELAKPFGVEQKLFHYFYFKKNEKQ